MRFRSLANSVSIALALTMPFTVINMTRAVFDDGTARTTLGSREDEVRRLAELDGDIRSLAPAQASAILSRHGLPSAGDLAERLTVARTGLAAARADFANSTARLQRAMVIGFLCVAATSWAAVSLATVWPRERCAASVAG